MGGDSAVGRSSSSSSLSSQEVLLSASLSSFMSRCICQPLDVVKIRMQVQNRTSIRATQIFANILKEEGLKSLWKGHVPAQSLSVVFSCTQFLVFEAVNKLFENNGVEKKSGSFVAGTVAGVAATIVSYPLDVARTRLVVRQGLDRSVLLGQMDLFRGLLPSLASIGPYVGLQFGFYSLLTSSKFLEHTLGPVHFVVAGGAAGLAAKTLVFPLDTIKKRLQVQNFDSKHKNWANYQGFTHCCTQTWRSEGFRGFYKGLVPGLIKATAGSASHFAFYELVASIILSWRQRDS